MTFQRLIQSAQTFISQHWVVFLYSLWEYWLGKTKKIAANSTWELIGKVGFWVLERRLKKETNMEKDIKLGTVGGVELKFEGGKAVVAITASESVLDGGAVIQGSASASVDASILIDKIFAAIEARSPAGTVMIEEAVKIIVKNAVLAIK